MTRTDIHRPANFDPADYRVIDYLDNKRPDPPVPATTEQWEAYERYIAAWQARVFEHFPNWRTGGDDHASIFTCNHCGHPAIRYVAVVEHVPTGKRLAFGETCAERVGLEGRDEFRKRFIFDKAKRELAAYEREQERLAFRATNPEVVTFLESLNDDYDSREPEFLLSLKQQLRNKGSLSDAQVAAAGKFLAKRKEWAAKREADEAEHAPTTPLVEGRRTITGTIVSTKVQHSDYHPSQLKMLVREDDGNKVWGTVPRAVEDLTVPTDHYENGEWYKRPPVVESLRGQRVTFTATVKRSEDDPHFGFFSRPNDAKLDVKVEAV